MDITIRVAGEAGQGVQTTGNLLVGALAGLGLHVFSSQSYMSRIRGGLNWFDIRISDFELFGPKEKADLLVALTDAAYETLRDEVSENGVALFDGDQCDGGIAINFTEAAKEVAASKLMANTVAAGAVFAVLGYSCDKLCEYLTKQFRKKGDEIIANNINCAQKGAQLAQEHAVKLPSPQPADVVGEVRNGAEAIALSAAASGMKFVTAYPMTPSTAVFTYLASLADEYGIVVEQAEDEIGAVNMVCGATYGGVPAMTTTSGGGFALMVEGLSLAGIMELPIFIVLAQRPGPATGLPTRTAQQDLKFAINAGHGEFAKAVFSPGTRDQCFDLTRHALQLAHKYQTPAILLTDQFLQDAQKTIPPIGRKLQPIDRRIEKNPAADYIRYSVTESGVSPRAIPGGEGLVVCDSDVHLDTGHITEDLDVHLVQHDKRMRKLDGLRSEFLWPEFYGAKSAETLFITWGSTYGPAREAVDSLDEAGVSVAMLHFGQVWPIDAEPVRNLIGSRKRIVCIEGNSTGQLASLLRQEEVLGDCDLILRYDGLPFTAEYIVAEFRKVTT